MARFDRAIFTNRNLRLSSVKAVGFDLDHTLAVYRRGRPSTDGRPARPGALDLAVWRATVEKLVGGGYPPVLRRLKYDPGFPIRGLLLDTKLGNILKVDRHKYPVLARHGTGRLPDDERKRTYHHVRIEMESGRFAYVDTFFEFPETHLWASLVDLFEARGERPDFGRLYRDVRAAVDLTHRDGSVKPDVIRRPGRYVERDARLAAFLDRLRRGGLKVFLLTNSEAAYTEAVMRHLLPAGGRDGWRRRFDAVVVSALKPAFYKSRRRVAALERSLGARGPEVLYFGDHTFGDILRSKKGGWRTAMIVPEVAGPRNRFWGDPFVAGGELSRFADQIRDFACVYTARVTNLMDYPLDHYFEARRAPLPHEM